LYLSAYCSQHAFDAQLWGSLGSVVFLMVLFIHPVFLTLGILGQFPYLVIDIVWIKLRYAIATLALAKLLNALARPVAKKILVLKKYPC
jgi:hypothetical protein